MRKFVTLLICLLFACIWPISVHAQAPEPPGNFSQSVSIGLAWDASVSENITNYRIYWGNASHVYTNQEDAGDVLIYHVEALGVGTWYFAATAISADGLESDFSNEVSMTVLAPATVMGSPDIQGPFVIDLTGTTARLAWKSLQPATSRIEYSYPNGPFSSFVVSTVDITDHYVRLTELTSGQTYNYEVFCELVDGTVWQSSGSFKTR